jgi:Bacterial hydrolase
MRRVPVDGSGDEPGQDNSSPEPQSCSCPLLDAEDWHEVESDWSDIVFIQIKVPAVMGVPLKFGAVKERLTVEATAVGATIPEDAMMLLGEGRVRRPVMLEVEFDGETEPGNLTRPGGIAFTRLVPAPWGQIKAAHQATVDAAVERYGKKPDAMWLWYITCGICSGDRDFETLFVAHYKHAPVTKGDAD